MSTIYPTHSCFDDAIDRLQELGGAATLVHAICVGDDGTRYAHAWVEHGGVVWDSGQLADGRRVSYAADLLDFYRERRVQQKWRYTILEMLRENRRHGTYGPWEPDLRALCRQRPRVVGRSTARTPPAASSGRDTPT